MSESLRVLVVGGGIGGLALSGALSRAGAAVDLVEKSERWRPLGAGLVLGANAVAVLGALGLGDGLAACGHRLPRMSILEASGSMLQNMDMAAAEAEIGPTYTVHRADLHHLLLEHIGATRVRLGTTVNAVEDGPAEARARFTDGSEGTYDLIMGCDGLRSVVRELAFPQHKAEVSYAGYTCWRTVMPNVSGQEGAFEMWGSGLRVGLVPLRSGQLYVFMTENTAAHGTDPEDGRHAWVADKFKAFAGPARPVMEALAASPQLVLMRHDIEDLSAQIWRGQRVGLLGDAGHATTPNLGQGAGMALEDALALTQALRQQPDPASALIAYERTRAARVERIVRTSRQLGAVAQWSNPVAVALHNLAMRLVPDAVSARGLRAMVEPGLALARAS